MLESKGLMPFQLPFVREEVGAKCLHFSHGALQSRMRLRDPRALDVDYTRTMMGFLLLNNSPKSIAMIGLGGGSLVKFCYWQLPATVITVAEINPHVIGLRKEFCVPDDDDRLQVIEADGADFIRSYSGEYDVLLVDGFDLHGQAASLCSQGFYEDCSRALSPRGVMMVNLHSDHPDHELFVKRINRGFGEKVVEMRAATGNNSIVMAAKVSNIPSALLDIHTSLAHLNTTGYRQLKPEFGRLLWHLRGSLF